MATGAKKNKSKDKEKLKKMLRGFGSLRLKQRDIDDEIKRLTQEIMRFARKSGMVRREANTTVKWPFKTVTLPVQVESRGPFYLIHSMIPKLEGKKSAETLEKLYRTRRWDASEIHRNEVSINELVKSALSGTEEGKKSMKRLQKLIEQGYIRIGVTEQIRVPTPKKRRRKK